MAATMHERRRQKIIIYLINRIIGIKFSVKYLHYAKSNTTDILTALTKCAKRRNLTNR